MEILTNDIGIIKAQYKEQQNILQKKENKVYHQCNDLI